MCKLIVTFIFFPFRFTVSVVHVNPFFKFPFNVSTVAHPCHVTEELTSRVGEGRTKYNDVSTVMCKINNL